MSVKLLRCLTDHIDGLAVLEQNVKHLKGSQRCQKEGYLLASRSSQTSASPGETWIFYLVGRAVTKIGVKAMGTGTAGVVRCLRHRIFEEAQVSTAHRLSDVQIGITQCIVGVYVATRLKGVFTYMQDESRLTRMKGKHKGPAS